ncbi:hypothetical protein K438DRAFT_1931145 [Mycena galopus ATCC 62051]|nr:hypothetical protein K438DRAFT_1931145 [Mycena galopus ATCC 62051]
MCLGLVVGIILFLLHAGVAIGRLDTGWWRFQIEVSQPDSDRHQGQSKCPAQVRMRMGSPPRARTRSSPH